MQSLPSARVVWSPTPPLGAQAGSAPPKSAAPATTTTPAKSHRRARPREIDGGWPRDYATPSGGAIRVFQPQIASWDGQRQMVLYAAVSYSAKGATKPALGTVKIEADSTVAVDDRLVNFTQVKLTETNFPGLPNDQLREVVATISEDGSAGRPVIALDRVLARLDKSQIIPKNVEGVKADPPVIFYSTSPAVLVNLDGDPIWSPIKDNDLKFAVNTNWDLFEHTPDQDVLPPLQRRLAQGRRHQGTVEAGGQAAGRLSRKLPADDNWKEVKAAVPGRTLTSAETPKVFVSTTPAELILVAGRAELPAR